MNEPTVEESFQELIQITESGEIASLTTEDATNLFRMIVTYQVEIANKDKDIDMYKNQIEVLEETVAIYKEIADTYEKSYTNIKG